MQSSNSAPEVVVADIGATFVRAALARGHELGPIIMRAVADLPRDPKLGIVPSVARLLGEAVNAGWPGRAAPALPRAAGIGICAAVDGVSAIQKPLPFGVPAGRAVADVVGQTIGVPVAIDNDANMAALGELRYGAGRGFRDFLMLTLGTNIGMGVVAGGQVLRGAHGGAGEAGMLLFPVRTASRADRPGDAREVDAGQLGKSQSRAPEGYAWIEELVGGGAIARALGERWSASTRLSSGNLRVLREAASGDADANFVLDRALEGWAFAIANYVALFDPAAIILAGGLSDDIAPFLQRLQDRAAALSRAEPHLAVAQLGSKGGLIGASVAAAAEIARA